MINTNLIFNFKVDVVKNVYIEFGFKKMHI